METIEYPSIDNDEEISTFIAEKGCEIFRAGVKAERQRCVKYFTQCADQINFGDTTPNDVIRELVKIKIGRAHV